MRLDKLLAHTGYGTRRDVKEIIKNKRVKVNEKIESKVNFNINPEIDVVLVDDVLVNYSKFVYIMLNKPQGYLSATKDNYDPVVIDLIQGYDHYELFPIGRLDKNTEGLLLITNDGEINHKLTSPNYNVPKKYFAHIKGRVTEEDIIAFENGVVLDDGYETKPGYLKILSANDVSMIELIITEGKFHQVKRMFKAVNKEVIYLKRIGMGAIRLDEQLELSEYRLLNDDELEYLKKL